MRYFLDLFKQNPLLSLIFQITAAIIASMRRSKEATTYATEAIAAKANDSGVGLDESKTPTKVST